MFFKKILKKNDIKFDNNVDIEKDFLLNSRHIDDGQCYKNNMDIKNEETKADEKESRE